MHMIFLVTNLGDSAVTGAFALLLAANLLAAQERRAALAMLLSFAASGALIAFGKIALYSHCGGLALGSLHSPSGHAATAAAVYMTAASIVAAGLPPGKRRFVPLAAAFAVAIGVSLSRIAIHVHTYADIAAGLAVGFGTAWFLWRFLLRGRNPQFPKAVFACQGLLALLLLINLHVPAEKWLHMIATHIQFDWDCRAS